MLILFVMYVLAYSKFLKRKPLIALGSLQLKGTLTFASAVRQVKKEINGFSEFDAT